MKLTFDRKAFSDAFAIAAAAAPSRTTKEVLKNVLLSAADGVVTLRATDSEVGIEVTVPETAGAAVGTVLLPTARMQQILREISTETITLSNDKDSLSIVCGASDFRLSVGDPAEFPQRETIDSTAVVRVTDTGFRKAMMRTVFACDAESTRYALGGVLFELDKGQNRLWLVATDSRRLAVASCAHSECLTTWPIEQPIVPNRAISLLLKTLTNADEEVAIAMSGRAVQIKNKGTLVTSQLVEGRFPQWKKVVPEQSEKKITAVIKPLVSAIRQAQITTGEDSAGVDFAFRTGVVRMSSGANDLGSARVDLPLAYDGPDLTICFDPRWLLQMLNVLDPTGNVTVNLNGPEDALLLESMDGYRYVVMPLTRDRAPTPAKKGE